MGLRRETDVASSRLEQVAPGLFVGLWSTGFVAARYATRDAGPLTFLSLRLLVAGSILAVVAVTTRAPRPTRAAFGWAMLAGLGMQAIYLGGVFVAIDHGLPTGISALIAGVHPLITSLASSTVLGERLRRIQWIGVAIGLGGVVLVVVGRFLVDAGALPSGPLLAAGLSVLGMSGGTLVQRRHGAKIPLLWGTVAQYVSATVVLGLGAIAVEHVEVRFTAQSIFALAWAIGVLAIAAVLLMLWLLQRVAASRVSSLFFLTPALSAIEGAILFGERLGALAVIGLVVALAGVALVVRT
ncbi:MAG: EamA family transporter [Ilumatobacteraceae bacterium]